MVNQVGLRLGFRVRPGRYRGTAKSDDVGFDGLWTSPDGASIIIEVKTTDAYRMSLDIVANYRSCLISKNEITEGQSSILYVVGRKDTGDLEAQVRGSRHAWDIRLISVEWLLHLMKLKEDLEDPQIMDKIRDVLTPQEFTRVDRIIDLVFSTANEIKKEDVPDEVEEDGGSNPSCEKRFTPVKFRADCVQRISRKLGDSLVKRSSAIFSTPSDATGISCAISKTYKRSGFSQYWFAFHPSQKEALDKYEAAFVCFGCGSADNILMIPREVFYSWLNSFNRTEEEDRFYWHVHIYHSDDTWTFHAKSGGKRFPATQYFLSQGN